MPHTDPTVNAAELKTSGLKATLPRLKILQVFQETSQRHLSAEDVFRALLAQNADIGLATVYRVLGQFEQAGLLVRSLFDNDRAVYELNGGQHHDHLVCLHCGQVEEFHDPEIERLQQRIAQERGFELREHTLALYGVCTKPACQARLKLAGDA
jgi:Fur family ferric uptake transcriptional regulator